MGDLFICFGSPINKHLNILCHDIHSLGKFQNLLVLNSGRPEAINVCNSSLQYSRSYLPINPMLNPSHINFLQNKEINVYAAKTKG